MTTLAPIRGRRTNRLLACLYLVAVCAISCSTEKTKLPVTSGSNAAVPPSNRADEDLSGLWIGRTITGGMLGMPGLIRSIKLNLQQVADKITGTYVCYSGKTANSFCRNSNENGTIEGTARGRRLALNVMLLPDASNCRFIGTLNYEGHGEYTCYLQGQVVEQGTWELTRAFR
jgi:hypothetical protein